MFIECYDETNSTPFLINIDNIEYFYPHYDSNHTRICFCDGMDYLDVAEDYYEIKKKMALV